MDADLRAPTPPFAPRPLVRWLWQLVKDVVEEYRRDGVGDLAAAITFWTILSVPAAVLALVSTLSSLDSIVGSSLAADVERESLELVERTLVESETLAGAISQLFRSSNAGVATIATVVAIFTLSRAFAGLIRSLDVAYEVDEGRPWWYVRIVAIGLGLATIVVVAGTATFLALLPSLGFSVVGRWLAAPAAFVVLVVWAATVFHIGPNHRTPWKYDVPGAIFTAIGWVVTSQLFAWYVRLAGQANEVQSSIGVVLLALTLMYLLSVVMLVGAEINDVIARRSGVVRDLAPVTARARRLRDRVRQHRRRPGVE